MANGVLQPLQLCEAGTLNVGLVGSGSLWAPPAGLKNPGAACAKRCNSSSGSGSGQGPCAWCGAGGTCCRFGVAGDGCDGKVGAPGKGHVCVAAAGSVEARTQPGPVKPNTRAPLCAARTLNAKGQASFTLSLR